MLLNSKRNISKGRQISLIKTGEWIRNKKYKWNKTTYRPKSPCFTIKITERKYCWYKIFIDNVMKIKFYLTL